MGTVVVSTEDICFISSRDFFFSVWNLSLRSSLETGLWLRNCGLWLHHHPTTSPCQSLLTACGERHVKLPFLDELMRNFDLTWGLWKEAAEEGKKQPQQPRYRELLFCTSLLYLAQFGFVCEFKFWGMSLPSTSVNSLWSLIDDLLLKPATFINLQPGQYSFYLVTWWALSLCDLVWSPQGLQTGVLFISILQTEKATFIISSGDGEGLWGQRKLLSEWEVTVQGTIMCYLPIVSEC